MSLNHANNVRCYRKNGECLNKIKKELEAIKNSRVNNKLDKPLKYSTMVIDGELTLEEAWELYQADESNYPFKDVDGLILESGIKSDEFKRI